MALTVYSLLGCLLMLIVGVIDQVIVRLVLYPALRRRHEEAKVTASHGIEPNVVVTVFKVVNLLVLPALGLAFGDMVLRPLFA
jgi:hypothetical protein